MKVLKPISIGVTNYLPFSANYGYTNDGDYPAWNIATAYVIGDKVIVDSLQSTFQCVANNTGTAPTLTGITPWVRIGATNAWKPFDTYSQSQLVGYTGGWQTPEFVVLELCALGRFNSVVILNCDSARVRVKFIDQYGVTTYNKLKLAVDTKPVVDAWTYCFADLNVRRNFVFEGIDGWGTTSASLLQITFNNDTVGVPIKVGEVLVGSAVSIGESHSGVQLSLDDFSKKEKNEFGETLLIERAYSYSGSAEIEIGKQYRSRTQGLIASLRATACAFFVDEDNAEDGIVMYGFPRSFSITYETPQRAYASLEVEGLT